MIRAAALAAALIAMAGCEINTVPGQPGAGDARHVNTFHDDARGVTCWLYGSTNGGIACLPDWMLERGAPMALQPESLP